MTFHHRSTVLLVLPLVVLLGCNGGAGSGAGAADAAGGAGATGGTTAGGGAGATGGTSGTGGPNGGGAVPHDAVVSALESEYMQLAPRSNPDQRPAMVAYASALPGVEQAGWTDADHGDNFYAILAGGRPFAVADAMLSLPASAQAAAPPGPVVPPLPSGPVFSNGPTNPVVPRFPKAHLIVSLGTAFQNYTSVLQSMLEQAGYDVTIGDGSLFSLTTDIQDIGYFYWHTHSAWIPEDGVDQPVITTSSEASDALDDTAFIDDLDTAGLITEALVSWDAIAYPWDKNANGRLDDEELYTHKRVYAIRPEFIKTYFHFSDNSVVLQDSCTSVHPVFGDAFQFAKAGVYVGWNGLTRNSTPMALFTDRIIGGNLVAPVAVHLSEPLGRKTSSSGCMRPIWMTMVMVPKLASGP